MIIFTQSPIYSDASSSWGCGIICQSQWYQLRWGVHSTSPYINTITTSLVRVCVCVGVGVYVCEVAAVQWLSVSLVIARFQVQCPVGVVVEQGTLSSWGSKCHLIMDGVQVGLWVPTPTAMRHDTASCRVPVPSQEDLSALTQSSPEYRDVPTVVGSDQYL